MASAVISSARMYDSEGIAAAGEWMARARVSRILVTNEWRWWEWDEPRQVEPDIIAGPTRFRPMEMVAYG